MAALEFALVAPALIVVAVSLADVTNAVITWWQLSAASGAIARIGTTLAATDINTNSLSTAQATTASTALFGVIPSLITASPSRYGVTLSSVVMTPTVAGCTSNCTYVANTAWSTTLQGTAAKRPCGTLAAVADGTPSTPGTLPVDAFSPAPLLVVDVTYDFTPIFSNLFGAGLRLTETSYMSPRTGKDADWIRITGPTVSQIQCPGYQG